MSPPPTIWRKFTPMPDGVVTNLFHDSSSLVEAPDCSFTAGLLLISGKGHFQSIGQVW